MYVVAVLCCITNSHFNSQEEEEYETKGGRRRTWDDDYVLKRQFSALVPAFDPRPGRTNVQQTTDLEIPAPGVYIEARQLVTNITLPTCGISIVLNVFFVFLLFIWALFHSRNPSVRTPGGSRMCSCT